MQKETKKESKERERTVGEALSRWVDNNWDDIIGSIYLILIMFLVITFLFLITVAVNPGSI